MEIILIPERCLYLGGRRLHGARNILNVIGIAADKGRDSLWPEGGDDATGPSAPVISGKQGVFEIEGVHQADQIKTKGSLFA